MDNKKFFLGLGIGVIISSLMLYMSVICFTRPSWNSKLFEISDEEIIDRAKKLGMILLEEQASTQDNNLSDDDIILRAEQLGMIFKDKENNEVNSTKESSIETTNETMLETLAEIVDVHIPSGSSAMKISEIVHSLSLVDNSQDFLAYMEQNGKSNKIRAGYFKIEKGSSYEEIIKILTTSPS